MDAGLSQEMSQVKVCQVAKTPTGQSHTTEVYLPAFFHMKVMLFCALLATSINQRLKLNEQSERVRKRDRVR